MRKFILCFAFILNLFSGPAALASEKLTVVLDWFMNPDHAPLFVAKQQGFFKQAGLDVRFITPADPSDPSKLVAAKKADIALDYQPYLLLQIAQGLPIKQAGVLINHPLACMGVLASSSIHTLKDLKGKKIGYSDSGIDLAELKAMLATENLTLNDVELVNVHYNLVQALLSRRVDAVTGLMRNFELLELKSLGQSARAFYPEDYGFPMYDELIFVVSTEGAKTDAIKKFLQAVEKGQAYLQQHPQQSWLAFAKAYPELNTPLNRESWFASLPYFAKDPSRIDKQRCQKLANYLNKAMAIKIPPTACDY